MAGLDVLLKGCPHLSLGVGMAFGDLGAPIGREARFARGARLRLGPGWARGGDGGYGIVKHGMKSVVREASGRPAGRISG